MELAGQLSFISVGIGVVLVAYGLVKYFKQRAEQKRGEQTHGTIEGS